MDSTQLRSDEGDFWWPRPQIRPVRCPEGGATPEEARSEDGGPSEDLGGRNLLLHDVQNVEAEGTQELKLNGKTRTFVVMNESEFSHQLLWAFISSRMPGYAQGPRPIIP